MKQFSIDEYLKNPSRKVVTRDGRNVTIHCTNLGKSQPVVAQIEGTEFSQIFTKDGKFSFWQDTQDDLFFVTKKHEGWVNLYLDAAYNSYTSGACVYESKEEAEETGKSCGNYVTTAKIEWDE